MTLSVGNSLGPYEIVGAIGAGGMGEVYRARDTRLGREVALKVLPEAFARDAERLRRFEQEARAVAALNHPNILAVFDMSTHGDAPFLVMELLEGETLRERLHSGPLPLRKALDIAMQTAHGVAAAHEKGIVHRDLKPANVFLTDDGRVKILDFGLAKLAQREDINLGETQSPTRTRGGHVRSEAQTEAGVVLGTAGYMSPEQVRGKPADARSDIFALGTILYEMLSGKRAFEKDSSADTMAAILKEEPPELSGEGRKIPPAIERAVRHCLEKNPVERFQSARDLAFDLESVSAISGAGAALPPGHVARRSRRLIFATAGTLGLLIVAMGAYFLGRGSVATAEPTFHQLTFERGLIYAARFAPDGQSVYYSAAWNGTPIQLYSTNPNGPGSRSLGFNDSALFAVSPAEMAISLGCRDVFIGDCEGMLATVPLAGGTPRQIAENVISADWSADGAEMAVIREAEGKFQVEFPLGKVIYESEAWLDFLRISPRGDAVAFVQFRGASGDAGEVVVLNREGKQIARSSNNFISVEGLAWSPGGREVWFGATATHAWANAIHSLSLSGKERLVLRLPGMLRLQDVSRDGGVLLSKDVWRSGMQFRRSGETQAHDLSSMDGSVVSDISPDGQDVAFGEYAEAGGGDLLAYMSKTSGSPAVKLGTGYDPIFSPDRKWVLVLSSGPPHLVLLPTGAGEARDLRPYEIERFSSLGWMPGGSEIYFAGNDGHNWRMYLQNVAGGKPRAVTPPISIRTQGDIESGLVSHDGKLIFARDLKGKGWVYSLSGGQPQAVLALLPEDFWANWSSDDRSAYVYQDEKTHAQIFRIDIFTGHRQIVARVEPSDPAGLVGIQPIRITPDGKSYVYSYNRSLSDLYIVDGVK